MNVNFANPFSNVNSVNVNNNNVCIDSDEEIPKKRPPFGKELLLLQPESRRMSTFK